MGYVETLFGHQDRVLSIDALRGDNCVSVGGRDKTVRYWKIVEETQLVFRGGGRSKVREVLEGGLGVEDDDEGDGVEVKRKEGGYVEGSLECVAMIDETTFVTGGDSGYVRFFPSHHNLTDTPARSSISLWSTQKKKPIFTHPLAHGLNEVQSSSAEEGVVRTPRWITSLASLRYSDLFASGTFYIKMQNAKKNQKSNLTICYPVRGRV
jgi:ribosomal RNA-processing protein 9